MNAFFLDTSGLGELFGKNQTRAELAKRLYRSARSLGHKLLTTNYVITEFVALSSSHLRMSRPETIAVVDGLAASADIEIVHIDERLHNDAWKLMASRQDKFWSFVDCSSFVLMNARGITDALTTDHHFTQAGFNVLLK